jgi:hypothetical protein
MIVIQRQLGHSNLGITSIYLQGIDNAEIIETLPCSPCAHDPGRHVAATLIDRQSPCRSSRIAAATGRPA